MPHITTLLEEVASGSTPQGISPNIMRALTVGGYINQTGTGFTITPNGLAAIHKTPTEPNGAGETPEEALGQLRAQIFRLKATIADLQKQLAVARGIPSPNEYRAILEENRRLKVEVDRLRDVTASPSQEPTGAFRTITQTWAINQPETLRRLDAELEGQAEGYNILHIQLFMEGTRLHRVITLQKPVPRADRQGTVEAIFRAGENKFHEVMSRQRPTIIEGHLVAASNGTAEETTAS